MSPEQADVVIVGDGPAGLSAALFLAKNGKDVHVLGTDETFMHDAYLYNYLGIEEISGTEFMQVARRQVEGFGAALVDEEVVGAEETGDGFRVEGVDGTVVEGRYLVLTVGPEPELAEQLGVKVEGKTIQTDRDGRTSVDGVYAAGWAARGDKIQAAISVGGGAAVGLDILSREQGTAFHDFDVPPED